MTGQVLADLLKANPKARQQEDQIKEALSELRKLRKEGLGSRGYSLVPPYGEKRQPQLGKTSSAGTRSRLK